MNMMPGILGSCCINGLITNNYVIAQKHQLCSRCHTILKVMDIQRAEKWLGEAKFTRHGNGLWEMNVPSENNITYANVHIFLNGTKSGCTFLRPSFKPVQFPLQGSVFEGQCSDCEGWFFLKDEKLFYGVAPSTCDTCIRLFEYWTPVRVRYMKTSEWVRSNLRHISMNMDKLS